MKTDLIFVDFMLNTKGFFKQVVSPIKLRKAWSQLKSNQSLFHLDFSWFEKNSGMLVKGIFKYLVFKKVRFVKLQNRVCRKFLNITNSKIRIVEKALLNYFEILFEGAYTWTTILETEFKNAEIHLKTIMFKNNYKIIVSSKTGKYIYRKKVVLTKRIFRPTSFGFRIGKSAHQAISYVKTAWNKTMAYFLKYSVEEILKNVQTSRLKNTFNRFVKDHRFWEEIEKMFRAGYFLEINDLKVNKGSLLHPFLFNVFMHDFDQFMESQWSNAAELLNNKSCGFFYLNKFPNLIVCKYPFQTTQMFNVSSKHNKKYFTVWRRSVRRKYIQYVRYSNDLFVSVIGSRKFLLYLKKKIKDYLKSNLHVKISGHKSIHRDQLPISFLGHTIQLVYFHQKMCTKNKRLEAMTRYKNRVIRKLKWEKYKINKVQMNQLKKKVLQHVETILAELNWSFVQKSNHDVLASLSAYKLFGDAFAEIVRFSHLKELMACLFLWFDSSFLKNSMLQKLYNLVYNNIWQDPRLLPWHKNAQIYSAKFFNGFRTKKILGMFKEIRVIFKNKVKLFTGLTDLECVEIKSKQIIQMYTQKQLRRKFSKMIPSALKKEEMSKLLACSLVGRSLQKQSVRYFSVKVYTLKLYDKLREVGFMHPIKNQSSSCSKLMLFSKDIIIKYYNSVKKIILSWFLRADNFQKIKKVVELVIKHSCWLTLKRKFKLRNIVVSKNF